MNLAELNVIDTLHQTTETSLYKAADLEEPSPESLEAAAEELSPSLSTLR